MDCFIENGFVIAEEVFDSKLIENIYKFVSTRYLAYKGKFIAKFPGRKIPTLGISNQILSEMKRDGLFDNLIGSNNFLDAMEKLLGPDLALLNICSLWINDQDDFSKVLNKSLHQEIWTGAGVDTVNIWIPFQKTKPKNTMNVIPKSHYFGFFPNQNRDTVYPEGFKMPESLPMADLKPGSAVFFHSLLLHETSGKGEDIRYATSFQVKNTLSPATRQQQTFGYTALRNGPFSRIRVGLGNDFLSPLRTYGGPASNDQKFDPSDLE